MRHHCLVRRQLRRVHFTFHTVQKKISNSILNLMSTLERDSRVRTLLIIQAATSISSSPADIDLLYSQWLRLSRVKLEKIPNYTARGIVLSEDL